jgi:hypothetical protein
MNDTLKAAGRIGAELGAAKAEVERLRGLLREARVLLANSSYKISGTAAFLSSIDNALSQQADPTDTYTAVDMATAAAQAFRDGQAAVEPAPAQDGREAFKRALHSQRVFKLSSATINAAEWAWFHRPAQTEQQPEQSRLSLLKMIDAAMLEMRNISPPLLRSDCERLIRAALSAQWTAEQ